MNHVRWLLALLLVSGPQRLCAQTSADRMEVFAAVAQHVRDWAPEGARIYLEPADPSYMPTGDRLLWDLRIPALATGIPIRRMNEVLQCHPVRETLCRATDHPVVLVHLSRAMFHGENSAQLLVEMIHFDPDYVEASGAVDRLFLERRGSVWVVARAERLEES